jgi:predicted ferric reductase
MPKNLDHKIIIGLILLTTLPFLLLYTGLSEVLPITDISIFWSKLVFLTANISGFVGAILLVWSFLLGIRSLVALVTPDLVWVLKVHKWIGKYGLLLVLVHPLLEMYSRAENFLWLFTPDVSTNAQQHITFGRIALALFLIIYITSALIRGKIKYRPWKYIHYLSYPLLFLVFIHASDIGTFLSTYPALKALWFAMLAMYFILIFYRVIEWSGILKPKYQLGAKYMQGSETMILRFIPLGRHLKPVPGQFVYLQVGSFGESHPFSVMQFDETTGHISLGIKMSGSFTKQIDKIKVGDDMTLAGPFGVFTREAHNDLPKVLIAGGIGITPFVDVVDKYATDQTVLMYACRGLEQLVNHEEFKQQLGANYTAFLSNETPTQDPSVYPGYITQDRILSVVQGQNHAQRYQYFICGPKPFMSGMVQALVSIGIDKAQIFTEEFSY